MPVINALGGMTCEPSPKTRRISKAGLATTPQRSLSLFPSFSQMRQWVVPGHAAFLQNASVTCLPYPGLHPGLVCRAPLGHLKPPLKTTENLPIFNSMTHRRPTEPVPISVQGACPHLQFKVPRSLSLSRPRSLSLFPSREPVPISPNVSRGTEPVPVSTSSWITVGPSEPVPLFGTAPTGRRIPAQGATLG